MPAAVVRQRMQTLSRMIGRKASVVRRQIPGLNPGQAVETTKLEYGRGRGNFRWSGKMRRDWKEHQRRKHSVGPTLTLRDKS
ncbi:hypothetical protein Lal_00033865 [Lupinus albus]|nr:hypothetical protein Lal_00033865 [Lupinus albus]